MHIQRLVERFDGLANRLAQVEAAFARRHRVLHHVDGKRNHRTRPAEIFRRGLAKHQAERHGQTVVYIHLVDDGQVKIVLNHRLRNVRGQFRVADDRGHRARSPAFVGGLKLCRRANGEGRNHVQAESRGVVVVDQENDIRRVVLDPLLGKVVALEHGLPIGLIAFAQVKRGTNRRHVGGVNAGGDLGHSGAGFLI